MQKIIFFWYLLMLAISSSAFAENNNPLPCRTEEFFETGARPTVEALLRSNFVDAPVVEATSENTKGYGEIVDNFDQASVKVIKWPSHGFRPVLKGNEGGIVEGRFTMTWQKDDSCRAINAAVGGDYITGARDKDSIYAHEANYHPDGSQIVFPNDNQPFILLLAKGKNPENPDEIYPSDFVAFRFRGDKGFSIAPGVWHQPAYPLSKSATFDDKQGAVHACVPVNFMKEFGVVVRIPHVF